MADIYLKDPRVEAEIQALRVACKGKRFSEFVSGEGDDELQYVDLVMEGGGVLGIALVGYTYALEQVGLRFLRVGGTSAGAINAMALAALAPPAEPKTGAMVEILSSVDISEFVDGDSDAKDFINSALGGMGITKALWKGVQILDNLKEDLGLNPGKKFEAWLAKAFEGHGVQTTQQLLDRLAKLPADFRRRDGAQLQPDDLATEVAVVAADVTTETKAVFPRMADAYWTNHLDASPACYVRASMSIPAFFQPARGTKKGVFVDGGVMSNFPIDLFHGEGEPLAPTLGVLIGKPERTREIKTFGDLLQATFDSARHCRDNEFIANNPDYKQLVAWIDTGEHNWLNFSLTDAEKVDLFRRGVKAAAKFLKRFDWAAYKKTRQALAACPHPDHPDH